MDQYIFEKKIEDTKGMIRDRRDRDLMVVGFSTTCLCNQCVSPLTL